MKNSIQESLTNLKQGKLILYPTDTVWGIGCDATNYKSIKNIYNLKKRHETKSMICLVSDFKMLNQYVEDVPEVAYDILKQAIKPTTIIYEKPLRVAENIVAEDNTLAIRVVKDPFCKALIKKFKKPIISTSANISGNTTPKCFKEIDAHILKGVDYIVNLHRHRKMEKPSTIIKLTNDGVVTIIRN